MSVQVNTYVMYGVMLPYKDVNAKFDDVAFDNLISKYSDSAFNTNINPCDGLTMLVDGMDGEYIAVGHVVAKTGNHQHFTTPIAIEDLHPDEKIMCALNDLVNLIGLGTYGTTGWHVISHYR